MLKMNSSRLKVAFFYDDLCSAEDYINEFLNDNEIIIENVYFHDNTIIIFYRLAIKGCDNNGSC